MSRAIICIKFCVKLECSSMETIWMTRRLQLWAADDWQLHHDNASAHVSGLVQGETSNTQVTQPLLQPGFGTQRLLAFPKIKITFEREEISICQ